MASTALVIQHKTVCPAAWADGHIAELKRSPNHLEVGPLTRVKAGKVALSALQPCGLQVSSEFRSLCQSQLRLVSEVLQLADNQGTGTSTLTRFAAQSTSITT